MKYFSLFSLLIFSQIIGGCSSEEFEQEQLNLANDEITEILATTSGFCLDDFAGTRTTITMGSSSIENPVWAQNDTIGIYPSTGDQLSFPIVDGVGTSTCTFDGGGWALKTSSTYTAYSPFNRAYYSHKYNSALPISMLGQEQKRNDDTKHLGKYDIQIAKGQTPESGKISFAFEHKVCIVRMDIEVPEAADWTSIKLISNALFTTEATMDLSVATPIINATATSNSITLNLDWIETTEAQNTLTAYIMLLPIDFTGKDLKIKISNSRGKTYIADANIVNNNRNFEAQKARWITADSFSLVENTDYSWYNSVESTYEIGKASQLNALSKIAEGDVTALSTIGESEAPTFEGKTIKLTNDIDLLSLENWTPIEQFSGTFDGNNHTIKNLYCVQDGNGRLGLFQKVSNASIKNLTINGFIQQGNKNNPNQTGGIAGLAQYSSFENCHSNVNISIEVKPITFIIGGICGNSSYSNYYACSSNGTIEYYNGNRNTMSYLGGIVGYSTTCNFIGCYKPSGDIKDTNSTYSYVGGIVGFTLAGDNTAIWGCYNAANVTGRQPGLILGSIGTTAGRPNIQNSYYDGIGVGRGSAGTIYGIGTKFYGGSEQSYDYGTARGLNIEGLNAGIAAWNTENPSNPCNYIYKQGSNGLEIVANK